MSDHVGYEAAEAEAYRGAWSWCPVCEKRWNALDGRLVGCLPEHDGVRGAPAPVVEPEIRRRGAERYSIQEKVRREAARAKRTET